MQTKKAAALLALVIITIAIGVGTLLLCSGCDDIGPVDEGLLEAENGHELGAAPWPLTLGYGPSVTEEDLEWVVSGSALWWNDQIGEEAIDFVGEDDSAFIVVEVDGLPLEGAGVLDLQDELELTEVRYDLETYRIISCRITLNYDLAYDEATMELAVGHGVGHCLDLADDPGPPETVDLRSIMAKPADPLGELTGHDHGLLLGSQETQ